MIPLGVLASARVEASSAFLPTDLTGLIAWWDPSDMEAVTELAGVVSAVADKSGNGRGLEQTTVGLRPSVAVDTPTELSVLRFSSTVHQYLQSSAADVGTGLTVILAMRPNQITGANRVAVGSTASGGFVFRLSTSGVPQLFRRSTSLIGAAAEAIPSASSMGIAYVSAARLPAYEFAASSTYASTLPSAADDGDVSTVWHSAVVGTGHWLRLTPAEPLIATSLSYGSRSDRKGYYPTDFVIEGSMDGTTWTTLHTVTGETWSNNALTKTYAFVNATAWVHYRVRSTQAASAYMEVPEMWLNDVRSPAATWAVHAYGASAGAAWSGGSFPGTLTLGSQVNEVTPMDGDLGEVMVYGRSLSDTERSAATAYLAAKWTR